MTDISMDLSPDVPLFDTFPDFLLLEFLFVPFSFCKVQEDSLDNWSLVRRGIVDTAEVNGRGGKTRYNTNPTMCWCGLPEADSEANGPREGPGCIEKPTTVR